ncbi:MAG TPA: oxygenase MpaB family protein [Acidimicrobiales bacterium]
MLSITSLGSLPVLNVVRSQLRSALGSSVGSRRAALPGEQYTDPPGDPGWFGPGSVTWRVHADPSMLIGGIAALLLQTLHPPTMAGVADHSNYRQDPLGRLARTSSFVIGTTYGSTEVAERLVEVVKAVHRKVVGTTPDGVPYSATDPDLITWVHTTEVYSFLRAHQRFVPFPVRGEAADRYYHEMAIVAEKLGATWVPRSRVAVRSYLREMQSELAVGDQAREAIDFITTPIRSRSNPMVAIAHQMLIQAAIGLLPAWGRELIGFRQPTLVDWGLVRPAAHLLLNTMRFAGGEPPPLVEARRRCAAEPVLPGTRSGSRTGTGDRSRTGRPTRPRKPAAA